MPKVQRRPKRTKYSYDDLLNAIAAHRNGMTVREAAAKFSVPVSTLGDRCSGRYSARKETPGYSMQWIQYAVNTVCHGYSMQ